MKKIKWPTGKNKRHLVVVHGTHSVGAFTGNRFRGEWLVAFEGAERVVEMVIAAVRAVLQVRDGALYGVEVYLSVPVVFAWLRVEPRVCEKKSHPKVAALGVAHYK